MTRDEQNPDAPSEHAPDGAAASVVVGEPPVGGAPPTGLQADASPESRKRTPPPYPSERARTRRTSTQPETPIARLSSPPPYPTDDMPGLKAPPAPTIPKEYRHHVGAALAAPVPEPELTASSLSTARSDVRRSSSSDGATAVRPVSQPPRPASQPPRPPSGMQPVAAPPRALAADVPALHASSGAKPSLPEGGSGAALADASLPTAASPSSQPTLHVEIGEEWQDDDEVTSPTVSESPAPSPSPPRAPETAQASPSPAPTSQVPAIQAMRIIAVGVSKPTAPPPEVPTEELEVTDRFDENDPLLQALIAESADDAEELTDDDVAADSEPPPVDAAPVDEANARRPNSLRVTPESPKVAPPPPPPRRAPPSAPALDVEREKALHDEAAARKAAAEENARRQRRAWWEVMFSEDFHRATARLNDEQVVREVNFIEESLGVAEAGIVLDLGCGAGYHSVELASRGYGVVGYDLSLFQLSLAADIAQDRGIKLNLLQGDMREMAFEEMFDGVFCWNTTFGYFEEDKNLNVAQRIFRALKPGGTFLLDVLNRDFAAANQPSSVWYEGEGCVCMDDMQVDFISSRMRVKRSLILDDGRTRECVYSMRLYSLHELGKLLHEVGFKIVEASGSPATPGIFFGQNSPRIIILAQRP